MNRNKFLATTGAALALPLVPLPTKASLYNPCKDMVIEKPIRNWIFESTIAYLPYKTRNDLKFKFEDAPVSVLIENFNRQHHSISLNKNMFCQILLTKVIIESVKIKVPYSKYCITYNFGLNGLRIYEKDKIMVFSPYSINKENVSSIFLLRHGKKVSEKIAWIEQT